MYKYFLYVGHRQIKIEDCKLDMCGSPTDVASDLDPDP